MICVDAIPSATGRHPLLSNTINLINACMQNEDTQTLAVRMWLFYIINILKTGSRTSGIQIKRKCVITLISLALTDPRTLNLTLYKFFFRCFLYPIYKLSAVCYWKMNCAHCFRMKCVKTTLKRIRNKKVNLSRGSSRLRVLASFHVSHINTMYASNNGYVRCALSWVTKSRFREFFNGTTNDKPLRQTGARNDEIQCIYWHLDDKYIQENFSERLWFFVVLHLFFCLVNNLMSWMRRERERLEER